MKADESSRANVEIPPAEKRRAIGIPEVRIVPGGKGWRVGVGPAAGWRWDEPGVS